MTTASATTQTLVLFSLIPAAFALFAIVLGGIAIADRRLAAARWGSAAFAMAGLGVVLDSLRPPGQVWMLLYLHLIVVFCVLQSLSVRHRQPMKGAVALQLAATAAATGLVIVLNGELNWRMLIFHAGICLALSTALGPAWRWAKGGAIERLVAYGLTVIFSSYFLRLLLLIQHPLSSSLSSRKSFFEIDVNIVFHVIMAIGGILMGLVMIVALGHDLLRQQIQRSCTDALTRLGNRHALAETIEDDKKGSWRCGGAISLDLDRFKAVNDHFGHAAGEALLMAAADVLRASLGAAGRLCRIGGEEFVLLADQSMKNDLSRLAEDARLAIASIELAMAHAHVRPTASFGICRRLPGEPIDALLREADVALYRAKAEGRNCIVAAR